MSSKQPAQERGGSEVGFTPPSIRNQNKSEGEKGDLFRAVSEAPFFPTSDPAATPADRADFEGYIAQCLDGRTGDERAELERYLRANPGSTVRDWSDGYPRQLCEIEVDHHAPASGRARIAYVREKATRSLAHTLPLDIRREAARDTALVWNPLARRYRARVAEHAATQCASGVQSDPSAIPAASPPAPAPAVFGSGVGLGASESLAAPKASTGPSHEREIKHAILSKNQELDHE